VIKVEDWAEIRRLHRAEGCSIKEIARRLGLARNTVRSALRSEGPPKLERPARPSALDAFEPRIRALLAEFPHMPASVIAERVGWERSASIFRSRVAELRPIYLPADPVQRTTYVPGELAQWDFWFPPADIPLGNGDVGSPPVWVGVSGYSRFIVARMVPSRQSHDLLSAHLACLVDLGGIPRKGVYDNEGALSNRHGGRAHPTQAFEAFRGTLGMGVIFLKPRDPESKGLVERANGYFETSFIPGRRFSSPDDFDGQLQEWLARANGRIHRDLRCRPTDRVAEDRGAMLAFPPVLPDPALRFEVRLRRDHYVRIETCDYSVDPRAIGRRIDVRVDAKRVTARLGSEVIADHPRSYGKHRSITDPRHIATRDSMRLSISPRVITDDDVEIRDLSVYDRIGA
jgi:transposase